MKQRFRIYFSEGRPVFFNIEGNFFINCDTFNLYGIYTKPKNDHETEDKDLRIDGSSLSDLYVRNWIFT